MICDMQMAAGCCYFLITGITPHHPLITFHCPMAGGHVIALHPSHSVHCPVSSVHTVSGVQVPLSLVSTLGTLVGGPRPDQGSQGPDTADISFGRDGLVQLPKFS